MEDKFVLELTEKETNLVLSSLGERPLKEVFELVVKIKSQASKQIQARQIRQPVYPQVSPSNVKPVVAQSVAQVEGKNGDDAASKKKKATKKGS